MTATGDDLAAYIASIHALDVALDATLAGIRSRQDTGAITIVQAATERVDALEHHLAGVGLLRTEYLGGTP